MKYGYTQAKIHDKSTNKIYHRATTYFLTESYGLDGNGCNGIFAKPQRPEEI